MAAPIDTQRILEKLDALLRKNDYDAAKRHLLLWLSEADATEDGKSALLFCNELMGLCRKRGEEEEALGCAGRALALTERLGLTNAVAGATTYLNCATVFKAFDRAEDALPLFERARAIYTSALPPQDSRRAGLCNNMALALVDLGQFDRAEALYAEALDVLRKAGDGETEQAITLLNLATATEMRLGLEDGCERIDALATEAARLLDAVRDRTDGDYAFACEKCSSVFRYYGYFAYADELDARCRRIYEGT